MHTTHTQVDVRVVQLSDPTNCLKLLARQPFDYVGRIWGTSVEMALSRLTRLFGDGVIDRYC